MHKTGKTHIIGKVHNLPGEVQTLKFLSLRTMFALSKFLQFCAHVEEHAH